MVLATEARGPGLNVKRPGMYTPANPEPDKQELTGQPVIWEASSSARDPISKNKEDSDYGRHLTLASILDTHLHIHTYLCACGHVCAHASEHARTHTSCKHILTCTHTSKTRIPFKR